MTAECPCGGNGWMWCPTCDRVDAGVLYTCSTCGFTAYIDDCWCDREQCEHTEWVPEIESWVRCTANTLMHTPDTRVLCPAHCGCDNIDLGESGAA